MLSAPPEPPPAQVIVVAAHRWDSQRGILRRYQRSAQGWEKVGSPVRAWLGRGGLAPAARRLQNTGTTPAGVFDLPQAFGSGRSVGIDLPYERITEDSYWPYDPRDPRTYNVLQSQRVRDAKWRADGQWSERLVDYGRQYRFAAVIGYNLPETTYTARSGERHATSPADTAKGGGIFLHVTRGRPTAGCVAIPLTPMRAVLRWLDPAAAPVIVVGPPSITRGWRTAVLAQR